MTIRKLAVALFVLVSPALPSCDRAGDSPRELARRIAREAQSGDVEKAWALYDDIDEGSRKEVDEYLARRLPEGSEQYWLFAGSRGIGDKEDFLATVREGDAEALEGCFLNHPFSKMAWREAVGPLLSRYGTDGWTHRTDACIWAGIADEDFTKWSRPERARLLQLLVKSLRSVDGKRVSIAFQVAGMAFNLDRIAEETGSATARAAASRQLRGARLGDWLEEHRERLLEVPAPARPQWRDESTEALY